MSDRTTQSAIPLKPVYTPEDVRDLEYGTALGDPGAFPYTRGRRLETRPASWIHRELSGEGDAHRSNEQDFHKIFDFFKRSVFLTEVDNPLCIFGTDPLELNKFLQSCSVNVYLLFLLGQ